MESDSNAHNPYNMVPDEDRWKLFCMNASDGDAIVYKHLWESTPWSELVQAFALELTRQWRPPNNQ